MSTNLRPDASAARARRVGICGGGVAGLTLAARLARLGFAVTVLEARDEAAIAGEGVFLTLAPNGMNGLRAIGLDGEVAAGGIATTAIEILDERGRRLALIDQSDHAAAFGAPSVTIRRGLLASLLVTRARAEGATVRLGERVAGVTVDTDGVVVATEDGEALRFDLLAACDGLRSRVRGLVFPEFPEPRFTGLIGTGGFADAPVVPPTDGIMRMTFGREAFFGYIKAERQPVFWFNSYAADAAPGLTPEAYAAQSARAAPDGPAGQPRRSGRGRPHRPRLPDLRPPRARLTGTAVAWCWSATPRMRWARTPDRAPLWRSRTPWCWLPASIGNPTRPPRSHASSACAEAASARSSG